MLITKFLSVPAFKYIFLVMGKIRRIRKLEGRGVRRGRGVDGGGKGEGRGGETRGNEKEEEDERE